MYSGLAQACPELILIPIQQYRACSLSLYTSAVSETERNSLCLFMIAIVLHFARVRMVRKAVETATFFLPLLYPPQLCSAIWIQ